jgi:hypothetical protein
VPFVGFVMRNRDLHYHVLDFPAASVGGDA